MLSVFIGTVNLYITVNLFIGTKKGTYLPVYNMLFSCLLLFLAENVISKFNFLSCCS